MDEHVDERDLAAIRAEIASLRYRRSLLQHAVLSHPNTKRRLEAALNRSATTHPTHQRIKTALKTSRREVNTRLQQIHRSVTGITAFKAKDPDPCAPFNGDVLGIRIDIFSRKDRKFVDPYFVLLVQEDQGKQHGTSSETAQQTSHDIRLKIHKHTIPPFIPLASLANRYLHARSPKTGTLQPQNLHKLAQTLRAHLTAHHARLDALRQLEESVEKTGHRIGITKFERLDASGREFELGDEEDSTVRVIVANECGKDGQAIVEKVVVRTAVEDRFGSDEQAGGDVDGGVARQIGRRYQHIERAILSGDKSVAGILVRLAAESGT